MEKVLETEKFYRVGNNLSLDFINTEIAENGKPKNLLAGLEDFAAWAVAVDLIDLKQGEKLIEEWTDKAETELIWRETVELREKLREMTLSLERGEAVKSSTVEFINALLRDKSGYAEISRTSEGYEKSFHADFSSPQQLFTPIAESAADLLCYGNPG